MAAHADAIGFGNEEDFLNVILLSVEKGTITSKNNYCYHNLEINDGIEILSITHSNIHLTTKPYFKSKTAIPVTLQDNISACEPYGYEKRLIANSVPDEFPILFDYSYEEEIPEEIDTGKEYQLFLTAFAQTLKIYKNIEDSINKIPVLSSRFKSLNIHEVNIGPNYYAQSSEDGPVSLAGRVLDTKIITNSLTQQRVRWLKIDNILGNLEIVYPEKELTDKLLEEYYVIGEFWLIGYIESFHNVLLDQKSIDKDKRKNERLYDFDVSYM